MGHSYAGGEVTLIVIGGVLLLLAVLCLLAVFFDEVDWIIGTIFLGFIGGLALWGGVDTAADRYQRLEVANDMRQYYNVTVDAEEVDLEVNGRRLVEFTVGGCDFVAYAEHDDQLGRYVLENGNARLTASDLVCAR